MAKPGRQLTARQKLFVKEYVENGGFNAPAARAAGYTPKTARFGSHKFLDIPHVLAAIRIEVQKKLDAGVALGASVLEKLALNAKSEAVQLQAAEALLNRGGMRLAALTQHEHTHLVRDERSDTELRARILELQRELGFSGKVIEGEIVLESIALASPASPMGVQTGVAAPMEITAPSASPATSIFD